MFYITDIGGRPISHLQRKGKKVDCFDQSWRKGLNAPEWSFPGVAVEKWRSLVFWGRVIVPL